MGDHGRRSLHLLRFGDALLLELQHGSSLEK
jgi:hypothetical protein